MKNTKHVGVYLKLNEVNDADIIERLNRVRSAVDAKATKQGYIKELIRTDIMLDSLRHSYRGEKQV